MSDFYAKMHQTRFRLGLRPRPRWGSLQHSPRPSSWIRGPYFSGQGGVGRRQGGWEEEEEGVGEVKDVGRGLGRGRGVGKGKGEEVGRG